MTFIQLCAAGTLLWAETKVFIVAYNRVTFPGKIRKNNEAITRGRDQMHSIVDGYEQYRYMRKLQKMAERNERMKVYLEMSALQQWATRTGIIVKD
jgi:hypothetical protein